LGAVESTPLQPLCYIYSILLAYGSEINTVSSETSIAKYQNTRRHTSIQAINKY